MPKILTVAERIKKAAEIQRKNSGHILDCENQAERIRKLAKAKRLRKETVPEIPKKETEEFPDDVSVIFAALKEIPVGIGLFIPNRISWAGKRAAESRREFEGRNNFKIEKVVGGIQIVRIGG